MLRHDEIIYTANENKCLRLFFGCVLFAQQLGPGFLRASCDDRVLQKGFFLYSFICRVPHARQTSNTNLS